MTASNIKAILTRDLEEKEYPFPVRVEMCGKNHITFFVLVTDGDKVHREDFSIPTPLDLVTLPGVAQVRDNAAAFAAGAVHQGLEVL